MDAWLDGMDPKNVKEFGWALAGEEVLTRELEVMNTEIAARIAVDPASALDEYDLSESDRAELAHPERMQIIRESWAELSVHGVGGWVDDDLAHLKPWAFDLDRPRAIEGARGVAGYDLLMKRGVGALVLAILLAGCGGQSSSAQRANDKLDALEAKIATQYETAATPYNNYLDKATQQYIALVHRYADQLGPKEARRRLVSESNDVSSFCPPCAGEMLDAARKY